MNRHALWTWLLAGVLVFSLLCVACGDDDSDTDGDADGDAPTDGDETDGDETDGDETDGDTDGDVERCDPGDEGVCFTVLSGDLAGNYLYLPHEALPSGCSLEQQRFGVQYFENWSTFSLAVDNYDGPKEYSGENIQIEWAVATDEDGSVDYLSYRSMSPCKILVQNDSEGAFECKLYDNNDAGVTFDIRGVWHCP